MLNPLRKQVANPAKQALQHLIVGEPVKDLGVTSRSAIFTYDEIEQTIENHRKADHPLSFFLV